MTKTVLVYGSGISGCGAADALAKQGCRVLLYSDKETKIDNALLELLKKQGGGLYCGNGETLLQEVEQIVLSPGIPLANPLTDMAVQMGIEVISEVEAAYRSYYRNYGYEWKNNNYYFSRRNAENFACANGRWR